MWSGDGKAWTNLGGNSGYDYINNSEVVRDGWIYDDGTYFWVVYGNTDAIIQTTTLSLAKTTNFLDWQFVGHIDLSGAAANVNMVFAGKWFVTDDGNPHIVVPVASSYPSNMNLYEIHPTNSTMTTWSNPVSVAVSGINNLIDPYIVKKGSTYYLWYKNETTKYIEVASSTSPFSGYSVIHSGDWAGWGANCEAVTVVQIDSNTWRAYMERYIAQTGMAWSESTDDWVTWTPLVNITGADFVARSGDFYKRTR